MSGHNRAGPSGEGNLVRTSMAQAAPASDVAKILRQCAEFGPGIAR